jgi:GntR family transcriptional regulator
VTRAVGRKGGTFVAERKLEQDRTTLAGFSEQLRRHGMAAGARVLSATERAAGPVSAAALQLREGDQVHEVRRVRLGDGKPIVLEHSLFPAGLFPGLLQCRLDGSLYELLEARYGHRPHRARESLEPVTAGVREAEALEVAEGAPLMLVERVAYTQDGQPVEFARDLFRGDRTRIVVWTTELADMI